MVNRLIRIGSEADQEREMARQHASISIQRARVLAAYWKALCVALVRRVDPEGLSVVLSADEVGPQCGSVMHEDLEPVNGEDVGRVRLEVVMQEPAEDE